METSVIPRKFISVPMRFVYYDKFLLLVVGIIRKRFMYGTASIHLAVKLKRTAVSLPLIFQMRRRDHDSRKPQIIRDSGGNNAFAKPDHIRDNRAIVPFQCRQRFVDGIGLIFQVDIPFLGDSLGELYFSVFIKREIF